MKYTALITTVFRKEIEIEANSSEEAQNQVEELINTGEIDGTETYNFDTDITIYK